MHSSNYSDAQLIGTPKKHSPGLGLAEFFVASTRSAPQRSTSATRRLPFQLSDVQRLGSVEARTAKLERPLVAVTLNMPTLKKWPAKNSWRKPFYSVTDERAQSHRRACKLLGTTGGSTAIDRARPSTIARFTDPDRKAI